MKNLKKSWLPIGQDNQRVGDSAVKSDTETRTENETRSGDVTDTIITIALRATTTREADTSVTETSTMRRAIQNGGAVVHQDRGGIGKTMSRKEMNG